SILTIYAVDDEGHKIDPESPLWKHLTINAKRVKWVVEDELSDLMIMGERFFSIEKVNFLRATAVYLHQFLSKIQLERYTYEVIKKTFLRYPSISNLLIDYFYAKFSPQIEDVCSHCGTKLEKRKKEEAAMKLELTAAIENVEYEVHKDIFYGALHFIDHILKTNYFLEDSIGLAFRMDPKVLDPDIYKPLPYGFFFFYGRGYKGFHVRFEDMSRGGLRIVRTRDMEHYDFESVRVFDEVFALSWAQHLKNKDIPEGGSKGIILLHPNAEVQQSVECVIDSMLDLLVPYGDHPLHPNIVDHYGKPEYIYLGPDENMRDDLIEWIIDRAKERHYKYPNAFMSSKPGVGINHKKYGVTSQGVNVYVENTLRYLKIDPYEEEFTVRMVGGPDGDVAGNELKILIKTYPKVKILAISDGEGAAYDPLGLDKGEILRLAEASLSIAHFDKKKLKSPGAYVVTADTPEGRKMRDEQQLSNEIHAHLYIPAGGRPNTINIDNWKSLLDSAGRPVVKAIIEGANLFLTNEARLRLESRGVIVIRDSSANKGGVICSSYEVLACLMLTEEEFLAIKDEYVYEVIEILKEKAQLESELLFREYNLRNGKIPLTHLSKQISKEINDLTLTIKECIGKEFEKGQRFDLYERILKSHFPPILRQEKYWHRAATMIPEAHRLAILATTIASYIIYREGLGWIQSLNYPDIVRIIQVYLEQDRLVSDYIRTILESNLPGKETIAQILDHNARKELTREILMAD
ncbi:MAG: amino acid dehydrogenase, partial [Planctomycetota bacterium]